MILIDALDYLFLIIEYILFARAILSWFPIRRDNPIIVILLELTEPILSPIRKLLSKTPLGNGMLDFSILFAFLLIYFIRAQILPGLSMLI